MPNSNYQIPILPLSIDLGTKAILKRLYLVNKRLAELRGVALSISKAANGIHDNFDMYLKSTSQLHISTDMFTKSRN